MAATTHTYPNDPRYNKGREEGYDEGYRNGYSFGVDTGTRNAAKALERAAGDANKPVHERNTYRLAARLVREAAKYA